MNLGEFREQTKDLPHDTELAIWEDGDVTWYEGNILQVVGPTPDVAGSPPSVLVLHMGQQVELEFDLAKRTGIDG